MIVYEKIYLEVYINNHLSEKQYCMIIFMLERVVWIFPVYLVLGMPPDIHKFPAEHMVNSHCPLEKLGISQPSLGVLEKFKLITWHLDIFVKNRKICLIG